MSTLSWGQSLQMSKGHIIGVSLLHVDTLECTSHFLLERPETKCLLFYVAYLQTNLRPDFKGIV